MAKPNCALITGASSGIGEAFARVLAADGVNLYLLARRAERLDALKTELEIRHQVKIHVIPCDLRTEEARLNAWQKIKSASQNSSKDSSQDSSMTIDCLINNAGLGANGWFAKMGWQRMAETIDVNISALTHFASLALPDMMAANRGWICNVSSTAGFQPGPKMAVYYASKAYVTSLSEALTHEVRHTAIKISALCPGPVETEFASAASMHSSRLFRLIKPMTSEKVARIGYRGMLKGQPVVIDSAMLSGAAFLNRFLPRRLILSMTAFLNGAARKKKKKENDSETGNEKGHRK